MLLQWKPGAVLATDRALCEHGAWTAAEPVPQQHRPHEPTQQGLAQLGVQFPLPAGENILQVEHLPIQEKNGRYVFDVAVALLRQ
ncbi:unnamed protein product [Ascophyllum nodosum]